jgi:citrate lyase subunit beta/citryl-CoA lyase
MTMTDLSHCRSLLFLPASNPRAIAKARELPVDMIVLDLEDAVKAEDKSEARRAAAEAARLGFGGRPTAIRVNAVGSEHFGEDIVAVRRGAADYIVLPKVEDRQQVHDAGQLTEKPILAMIETAAGVLAAPTIAQDVVGLIIGTNDLAADLRLGAGEARAGLMHALQTVVLAARAAGVPAFDGVYNRLEDEAGLAEECRQGRAFGYDGKSLIHPGQIEIANRLFGPSEEEIAAAERLIAAATGGAERFEGRMIESMHVDAARAVLARARR